MDLVGVSSPEPGPAAAWGPNKVRDDRGKCTSRGHLGWFCRRARRGWQVPRRTGRLLGKFWARPRRPRQGGTGGRAAGVGVGEAGRGPRRPETWGLTRGRPPCCLKLHSVSVGRTRSETGALAGRQARACFGRAE